MGVFVEHDALGAFNLVNQPLSRNLSLVVRDAPPRVPHSMG